MFHRKNSTTTERYVLDGMPLEFDDVCGRPAVSRARRIRTTDIKDQFLGRGWLNDVLSHGAIYTRVEGYVRGDLMRRWVEEQVRSTIVHLEGLFIRCLAGNGLPRYSGR